MRRREEGRRRRKRRKKDGIEYQEHAGRVCL